MNPGCLESKSVLNHCTILPEISGKKKKNPRKIQFDWVRFDVTGSEVGRGGRRDPTKTALFSVEESGPALKGL